MVDLWCGLYSSLEMIFLVERERAKHYIAMAVSILNQRTCHFFCQGRAFSSFHHILHATTSKAFLQAQWHRDLSPTAVPLASPHAFDRFVICARLSFINGFFQCLCARIILYIKISSIIRKKKKKKCYVNNVSTTINNYH